MTEVIDITGRSRDGDRQAVVFDKLIDAEIPGADVEFSPEEADLAGAFREDAIGEDDALDSIYDGAEEE